MITPLPTTTPQALVNTVPAPPVSAAPSSTATPAEPSRPPTLLESIIEGLAEAARYGCTP